MIDPISITGLSYEVDEQIQKYIRRKVGKLDRYMPKSAAKTARAEVKLSEESKGADKYSAEVILHLTSGQITAKDSAINMFAAVDIVEAKLRNQLNKHHDKHAKHSADRKGALQRLRRLADRDFWGRQN
jgi:putative sigma-54 modulation protein